MGTYIKTCIIHLRQCENMYALCIITRTREHVCKCVYVTVCICRLYRITLIFVVKNLADWYSKYFQLQIRMHTYETNLCKWILSLINFYDIHSILCHLMALA